MGNRKSTLRGNDKEREVEDIKYLTKQDFTYVPKVYEPVVKPKPIVMDLSGKYWTVAELQHQMELYNTKNDGTAKSKEETTNITILFLVRNKLPVFPELIFKLTFLQKLDISQCELQAIPNDINRIKTLEILIANSNYINKLPPELFKLGLKYLSFSGNQVKYIPEEIGQCKTIEGLYMNRNKIEVLPQSIVNLTSMVELWCEDNQLGRIPKKMKQLYSLDAIKLQNNPYLPKSLAKNYNGGLFRLFLQQARFNMDWNVERLLWIAIKKESSRTCAMAIIDHNVMRLIIAECVNQMYLAHL